MSDVETIERQAREIRALDAEIERLREAHKQAAMSFALLVVATSAEAIETHRRKVWAALAKIESVLSGGKKEPKT
jgi:hypothetical protein